MILTKEKKINIEYILENLNINILEYVESIAMNTYTFVLIS